MTSMVTVNAHSGLPISVTLQHGEPSQPKAVSTEIVVAGAIKIFYIHSGLVITDIHELPPT